MSKTRLLSPFCVLSRNQSSSLFSGLLCRFRYSPVERFFYKFDGIDCCSKLNAKFVNRLIHRCWQLPPPINSATHCFFDGCYHLIDGDVAVGLCHSLAPLFRSATAETTSLAGSGPPPWSSNAIHSKGGRVGTGLVRFRTYVMHGVAYQSLCGHERRGALVLDQEHQELRRLGAACVPVDDMNIVRAFIEGLSWCQCHLLSTLQLHHNGALQHVNKRMCIMSVNGARPAGRMLDCDHQSFPAGILWKILRHERRDLRLLSHRRAGHEAQQNQRNEFDRHKSPQVSALGFGFQLRPSKQESAPSETGRRCDNVRRRNPERPRSGWFPQAGSPHRCWSQSLYCTRVTAGGFH